MNIIKSSIFLGLSTVIKTLLGIFSVKVLAYFLGPLGFGKLGQFMSLMAMITTMAGAGISNGIVSKISESKGDEQQIKEFLSAGLVISIAFSLLIALVMSTWASEMSQFLFQTKSYRSIIFFLSGLQFFNVFSTLYGSYLNGVQKSTTYSYVMIIASIIGTSILILMVYFFGFYGAMIGLIFLSITPGILFGFLYFFYTENNKITLSFSFIDKNKVIILLRYSIMLLVSAFLLPSVQVLIRNLILQNKNSWIEVGYYQATLKVSESGLIVLNVIMANYYLPELGKCSDVYDLKKVINKAYLILLPLLTLYVLFIFLFKCILIKVLLGTEFLLIKDLLIVQSIGDSFKVLSLVCGFFIVSKGNVKIYIIFELLLFVFLFLFSYLLIPQYGVIGTNYAYLLSYILIFLLGFCYLKNYLSKHSS